MMNSIHDELIALTQSFKALLQETKPIIYSKNAVSSPKISSIAKQESIIDTSIQPPPPPIKKPVKLIKKAKSAPVNQIHSKPTEHLEQPRKKNVIELKPLHTTSITTSNDVLKHFQKANPHLFIHESIPNDREAKLKKNAWKITSRLIDIPIFTSQEMHKYLPFLKNLAKAIDYTFAPSRVIEIDHLERKNVWQTLLNPQYIRCILCPDLVLWASPHLASYYHQKEGCLGEIPVMLLPDLKLYLKDPLLKRSLWQMLFKAFANEKSF